jgi:hypothetical protein
LVIENFQEATMSRYRARTLIESLESRNLMAADLGLIGAVPPLSSNTFLLSQVRGAAAPQLNSNEGVAIALNLQTTSSFDLTSSNPSAFLAQTFFMETTPAPTLLPNSLVIATPLQ